MESSSSAALILAAILGLCSGQGGSENRIPSVFNYTDLDTWEPPPQMFQDLPYYHAGYDKTGRPVIVMELGRWNSIKYFSTGDKAYEELHWKYCEQLWYRITPEINYFPNITRGYFFIMDLEKWSLTTLLVPEIVRLYFRSAFLGGLTLDPSMSVSMGINVNDAAQTMFQLIKPFVGETFSAIEILGPEKEQYIARLLKDVEKDQLPPWYGGSDEFKPAKVFV